MRSTSSNALLRQFGLQRAPTEDDYRKEPDKAKRDKMDAYWESVNALTLEPHPAESQTAGPLLRLGVGAPLGTAPLKHGGEQGAGLEDIPAISTREWLEDMEPVKFSEWIAPLPARADLNIPAAVVQDHLLPFLTARERASLRAVSQSQSEALASRVIDPHLAQAAQQLQVVKSHDASRVKYQARNATATRWYMHAFVPRIYSPLVNYTRRKKEFHEDSSSEALDAFNKSASAAILESLEGGRQSTISNLLALVRKLRAQPMLNVDRQRLLTEVDKAGLSRTERRFVVEGSLFKLETYLEQSRYREIGGVPASGTKFGYPGSSPGVRTITDIVVQGLDRTDPQTLSQTHRDPTTGKETTQTVQITGTAPCEHRFEFTNADGTEADYVWQLAAAGEAPAASLRMDEPD